ncbi:D-inositol 3-phosphate glycosyltransferase [bacterium HR39]|nr:D-inositol 3-phosphate glycosyltransferase [bacterium HR39]
MPAPPRFCYLVPAHHLLPTAGPSRNVLSLARALAEFAEVTVAFRRIADPHAVPEGVRAEELDPACPLPAELPDDAAMRGLGAAETLRYLRRLLAWAADAARRFDVVLEKTWLFSGTLSARILAAGCVGVPVENFAPDPARYAGDLAKRLRLSLARAVAGRALRACPRIIAETGPLRASLVRAYGLDPARIEVVPLGIDPQMFRPIPQDAARARLGLPPDALILLYVGVLDRTHDLGPLLAAMAAIGRQELPPGLELHLVGTGTRREEYGEMARRHGLPVVFHGRRPHAEVPWWIAAADLCLAPYDAAVFAAGELGYATMKIPEYLAVGRPVVSVPHGRPAKLVRPGDTGFLFDNRADLWQSFLRSLPGRDVLAAMGERAARTPVPTWREVARRYFEIAMDLRERRRAA